MGQDDGEGTWVLRAPLDGVLRALTDVPDEVFATGLLGPGVAIEPARSGPLEVLAPSSGTIGKAHPHAVALALPGAPAGAGVLIHLGIDTVKQRGQGFALHVADGEQVADGQRLITWDVAASLSAGFSSISPVVLMGASDSGVRSLIQEGAAVSAGDPLLQWTP